MSNPTKSPAEYFAGQIRYVRAAVKAIAPLADEPQLGIDGDVTLTVAGYTVYLADSEIGAGPDAGKYIIGREVLVPGVRYRRDGSGEPDSVDFVDVGPVVDERRLAEQLAALVAADIINNALEAEGEAALAERQAAEEIAETQARAESGEAMEKRRADYL